MKCNNCENDFDPMDQLKRFHVGKRVIKCPHCQNMYIFKCYERKKENKPLLTASKE